MLKHLVESQPKMGSTAEKRLSRECGNVDDWLVGGVCRNLECVSMWMAMRRGGVIVRGMPRGSWTLAGLAAKTWIADSCDHQREGLDEWRTMGVKRREEGLRVF